VAVLVLCKAVQRHDEAAPDDDEGKILHVCRSAVGHCMGFKRT
jgi:hypothetical protein